MAKETFEKGELGSRALAQAAESINGQTANSEATCKWQQWQSE